MYDLGSEFANASVDPGTNILISGPPLTGKRRLAMDILARGADHGEGSVIVTTRDNADRVQADYRARVDDPEAIDLGIVDCVTQHQGRSASDTELVKYASSPVDMTGIGIKFSEFVEEFYTQRNVRRNRILLDSLSTLLLYSNVQTVFRFMHVFTSRIEDADALGVHIIDSTAHETEAVNTMKQLFDGVVEVDDERNVSVQIPGVDATPVH
jgi:KaiC/GvpD/RAD55 family RecA-like ATPase